MSTLQPLNVLKQWVLGTQFLGVSVTANSTEPDSLWEDVLAEARGETVYFNAWGGSAIR